MAKSKRTGKLRIATLLLALLMLLSFGVFALSACSTDDSSDDDDASESRTDTQTFANADFEYFTDSDGSYLIGSADNWTSSAVSNSSGTSASSSSAKSGIVDTASRDAAFDDDSWSKYVADPENETFDWSGFYYAYKNYVYYDGLDEEDDADELEDAEYFTDIDNYYDVPGWDLFTAWLETDEGKTALKEAGFDEDDFSDTSSDDLLTEALADQYIQYVRALNPGTHWANDDDAAKLDEEKGTHVLMLHNYRTNGYGTAMRYASSTITLQAGTAASVSVWVKTSGLTYNKGTNVAAGNRGAFIEIANNVGGTAQDPLVVRNINTKVINPKPDEDTPAENNGWVEYTFYIRASSYASTTFTVYLGLGRQAAGNTQNYYDYVQGYAFFDDLTYTVFEAKDWAEKTAAADQTAKLDTSSLSDAFTFNAQADDNADRVFALDLDELDGEMTTLDLPDTTTVADTEDDRGNTVGSYFPDKDIAVEDDLTIKSGLKTVSDITNGDYAQTLKDALENYTSLPFATDDSDNDELLLLYSSKGAPYTAAVENNTLFTVKKGETLMVSFWVKTSDLQGGTGATVTLIDGDTETAIGAVDTTTLETVDIKDDTSKTEDIFDGWQFCAFYVTTEEDGELTFSLEFNFGVTTIAGTTLASYVPGYAMFTGFNTCNLTEEQAALVSTGDYAKSVTLAGDKYTGAPVFDSPATNDKAIETGIADPSNYTGVYGGSYHVGGSNADVNNSKNGLATAGQGAAGLISKEYAGAYTSGGWLDILNAHVSISDLLTDWNKVFGSSTQPLIIAKTVADSYGFVANAAATVSADSYTQITVRVKLSPYTQAYVYLIDTTEPDITDPADADKKMYSDMLRHETGVSYRYDEDGNLVNLDPEDEDFDRRDNVLLYYQDNGLWAKERSYTGSEYYANLANYEKDEDGNLTDRDGNTVYYLHDGAYYRYYDEDEDSYEVQVKDFTEAGVDLTGAKLQGATGHDLYQKVENNSGSVSDWIYIRFFIANGSESKTYRLEYWSGDRLNEEGSVLDAATNTAAAASNFVIFDVVQYADLAEESFNNLVNAQLESLAEDLGYADADALKEAYEENPADSKFTDTLVYYHFSLYDDADYAPFDADRTDGDDSYSGYDPTAYSNTVSYFKYSFESDGAAYNDLYLNFAASEEAVSSAADDGTTDTDDSDGGNDVNVWLLVSSILLAVVLVLTLLALLLRKLLAGMKQRKAENKVTSSYSNRRDIYIRKLKKAEAEEREEEEEEDLFTDAELYNETDADGETPADDAESADEPDGADGADEGASEPADGAESADGAAESTDEGKNE